MLSEQPRSLQDHRRPGLSPGRRFALAAAVVVAALVLPQSLAFADSGGLVPFVRATVYESTGQTQTDTVFVSATPQMFTQEQEPCPAVDPSAPNATIWEYGSQAPYPATFKSAWNLSDILDCLGVSGNFTGITVFQANGQPQTQPASQLVPANLTPGTTNLFHYPDEVPIVDYQGTTVEYERPWAGGSDLNLVDQVQQDTPLPIQLAVYSGPLLTVTVNASATSVSAGQPITVSTSVMGDPGSPSYGYTWTDADGPTLSDPTTSTQTITFPTAGSYVVTAQVIGSDGSGGVGSATITVGNPPTTTGPSQPGPAPTTSTTTTSPAPSPSPTPRGTSGSGGQPGKPTPERRGHQKTNTTKPTVSSSSTTSTDTGTTPAPAASTPTTTPAPTPTTPPPTTTTTPTTSDTTTLPRTSSPPKPAPSHKPASAAGGSRRLVTGYLISDVAPVPAGSSPLVHPAPATSGAGAVPAGAVHVSHSSPWTVIGSVLAVLALLGLGAGRELRHRVDWRSLLRQRPGS